MAGFLRTQVGRRFLAVNLLTAFVPVAIVATVAFRSVAAQLRAQAAVNVTRLDRTIGNGTIASLSARVAQLPGAGDTVSSSALFDASLLADAGAPPPPLLGAGLPSLTAAELTHLQAGHPLLRIVPFAAERAIVIARAELPWTAAARPVRWSRLRTTSLFTDIDESAAGEDSQFCLFEAGTLHLIHCSEALDSATAGVIARIAAQPADRATGSEADGLFASSREVYLHYAFAANNWRTVVVQSRQAAFASVERLRITMLLLTAAMLLLIFAVSHAQIRRTTEPLARLREGTRRLEAGDFLTPVAVQGDDEYAQVAASFNGMAAVLHRQITLMHTLDAVDQTALGTHDTAAVAVEALPAIARAVASAQVSIAIRRATDASALDAVTLDHASGTYARATVTLSPSDRRDLLASPRKLLLHGAAQARSFVTTALPAGAAVAVLPMVNDGELLGLVTIALLGTEVPHDELAEARRITDRIALALGTVHLVARLDALSAGTMLAFARAIDANSPWTAGHSERVTRITLTLGRQLSLSAQELDTLQRGSLLHDIGKIAVPPAILDKAQRLSDDEWQVMRRHPVVGCEILSPIPAFGDALPLVRSHHERMDGTGYPDRLRGEEIPYLARILAVADVFDALASDRPYRNAMTTAEASTIIQNGSGTHFDPRVVHALLDAVAAGHVAAAAPAAATVSLAAEVNRARAVLTQPA